MEANGYVSIEAAHYTKKVDASAARWEEIPDFGRTLSGMTIFPVTAASVMPPGLPRQSETTAGDSPCLEYHMYLFNAGKVEVTSIIAPSLNFVPGRGLRFAVSFDDEAPQIVTAVPKGYFVDNGVRDWEESVKDNARISSLDIHAGETRLSHVEILDGGSRCRAGEAGCQSGRREAELSRPAGKLLQS